MIDADKLLVVVGPTASGKSELALRIAEAARGEIVSADSVQVYRHFDIGSGKPTQAELDRVPHHLVSAIEPQDAMDAGTWAERAERCICEIRARGNRPIICGGSFLFVRALVWGLAKLPAADATLRAEHQRYAEREGRVGLHRRLTEVDPERAAELAPNDLVRVSRALEIHELSGIPMSQWQREHAFRTVRHPARLVGIDWPREQQDARIHARIWQMLRAGWLAEVQTLLEAGHGACRAMGAVGYRQIAVALDAGKIKADWDGLAAPDDEVRQLHDQIYRATRLFARRQRTWLRDQPVEWLPPGSLPRERDAASS